LSNLVSALLNPLLFIPDFIVVVVSTTYLDHKSSPDAPTIFPDPIMPSKSTMAYSNKHDENHPFSFKKLAQYINAIDSSQYEAMAKFYTENGPPGGKTWPEYLQFINDDMEGHKIGTCPGCMKVSGKY